MSYSLKTVAVVVALSLGALAWQFLPVAAEDEPGPEKRRAKDPASKPEARPRAQSNPRHVDAPLQHAILRDEKEDDSVEARIIRTLEKPTTVEFIELPLEECLSFLKEYHDINIWIDKSSLTDEGVPLDQPITLKLAGVRLESVLNLLLQPVQLDWVIQDEVMKITTSSWTMEHPEVRSYDVQNLIDAGHDLEDLMASITKCVEPGSWTGKHATAGISHTGGVLVIRQSQRTHSEISRLLAELDEIAKAADENDPEKDRNAVVSVKVYPTGEQSAEKLAECLPEFVAFKSWTNRGGQGKLRALKGALVVEQSADVHHSIRRFLAKLSPNSPKLPAGGDADGVLPDPFRILKQAGPPAAAARDVPGRLLPGMRALVEEAITSKH